ncbi:hypothetical protein [Sphingobium sp.]|uniref:hypothetical protein n=1 Tax=Sphingobium sp. TaxID=1912891 RepID=UPI003B3A181C
MSDIELILMSALAIVAISVLSSHWIAARRPGWSSERIALLSALPLPLLALSFAIFAFVRAMTASKEACGVDTCAMAMAGAMMIGLVAVVIYLVSMVIVFLIVRRHRR